MSKKPHRVTIGTWIEGQGPTKTLAKEAAKIAAEQALSGSYQPVLIDLSRFGIDLGKFGMRFVLVRTPAQWEHHVLEDNGTLRFLYSTPGTCTEAIARAWHHAATSAFDPASGWAGADAIAATAERYLAKESDARTIAADFMGWASWQLCYRAYAGMPIGEDQVREHANRVSADALRWHRFEQKAAA